jgi:hypothetical protein
MGLVNRVVPKGTALATAQALARDIAALYVPQHRSACPKRLLDLPGRPSMELAFRVCVCVLPHPPPTSPQLCMRMDRLSAYEQVGHLPPSYRLPIAADPTLLNA